jgi:hypothetical protein
MYENNNNSGNEFPEIVLKYDVYRKIKAYTDLCSQEISALGSVRYENNKLIVEELYLFDQFVTGSSTTLDPKDISKFLCEYIKLGKDPSTIKFWWHSHVNMGVFWSSTDTGTIDRFSSEWLLSMVTNKRGEFKLRFDLYSLDGKPFRCHIDNLSYVVEYDKSHNPAFQKEIDLKVHQNLPFVDYIFNRESKPYKPGECVVVHEDPIKLPKYDIDKGNSVASDVPYPKYDNTPVNKSVCRIVRNGVPVDPNVTDNTTIPDPLDGQYELKRIHRNWVIEILCGPRFEKIKKKVENPKVPEVK